MYLKTLLDLLSLIIKRVKNSRIIYMIITSLVFSVANAENIDDRKIYEPDLLEENHRVNLQLKGNYSKMNRKENLPLGAIQQAWNKADTTAGIYEILYNPHESIRIRVREHMSSVIIFPQWEEIIKIINGDVSILMVENIKSNIILIRPMQFVGVDSNITVLGASGNVYLFYLRVEGYNSKFIPDIGVRVLVANRHQTNNTKNYIKKYPKSQNTLDYIRKTPFDPSKLNFNYSMSGDESIAPRRVYGDGIRTWLDYDNQIEMTNLPVIFQVIDGKDIPVNYHREGSKIVVHAGGDLSLKNGSKLACIYTIVRKNNSWE